MNLRIFLLLFVFAGIALAEGDYPPSWAPGKVDTDCTLKDICPHVNEKSKIIDGKPNNRLRPPTSYTEKIKAQEIKDHPEVGCTMVKGVCELDHVIPEALCGSTDDPQNLAIEPAEPRPGFHEKDWVEEDLHRKVCDAVIDLPSAQDTVVNHWLRYWQDYHTDEQENNP